MCTKYIISCTDLPDLILANGIIKVRLSLQKMFEIAKRPLILDGAMGSMLTLNEENYDKWLWSSLINLTDPELVKSAHKQYIAAGADIITTNTFRTNPVALERSSYDISLDSFVKKSVEIAIEARANKNIIVAGSNAPAEDCYQIERTLSKIKLDYNHKKHIELLWELGSDFVLNETQSHWDEIEIISKFCGDNNIPFVMSFFFDHDLNLLSGEHLLEAIKFVLEYKPIAVSFNCIDISPFRKVMDKLDANVNWGFYLNCGAGTYTNKQITCGTNPKEYLKEVKKWINYSPLFVGSCCGSSPDHTRLLKEYFDEIY